MPSSRPSTQHTAPGKTQTFAALQNEKPLTRLISGLSYWDRLLSGGLVPGSVVLVGGEPGIGKSTLLAQLAIVLSKLGKEIVYVTGEESPMQVNLRLQRLVQTIPPTCSFLDQTNADVIAATILEKKPGLVIVDSVQTIRLPDVPGEAGNPTQMKAAAATISEAAKQSGVPVILVGQVTKDGDLAGPRLLEHLVDTVMMLEGDRSHAFRLLRLLKHRFGSTDESAVLSMGEKGLEEVLDPSAAFLADRPTHVPGTIVSCLTHGSRPILVEIQALVSPSGYGTPSRRATGIDPNRLSLLLAVLGRRAGVSFSDQDVFVNAVGGVDAKDPSVDLAVALALVSARKDRPIAPTSVAWGEIGLSGEVRPVVGAALREREAKRLGFKTILTAQDAKEKKTNEMIVGCKTAREAIGLAGLG